MNRRELIRHAAVAAGGLLLGGGCASGRDGGAGRGGPGGRGVSGEDEWSRTDWLPERFRGFSRVQVRPDRVIRTIAGSRPFRPSGFVVRAERFDEKTVIHNYGHGGGGLSLCWGSSALAVEHALEHGGGGRARRAAVIGAGALGLTTARLLQDRGFQVTIHARDLPPHTTSNVAGAQWSPFSVSDPDATTPAYDRQFERAARIAHRTFQNLVGPRYGVRWIENFALSDGPPRARTDAIADLFPECEDLEPGTHPFGERWLRCFTTMFIEPAPFLDALTRDVLLRGGRIEVRDFPSLESVLCLEERLVVNCTGLGARWLFEDEELIPIKGDLAVLAPQPEIDYILLAGEFYMFPRSDGILLGGSRGRGDYSTEPDPRTIERILEGHGELFSSMTSARSS